MLGSTAVLNHSLRKYKTIQVTVEIVSLTCFSLKVMHKKADYSTYSETLYAYIWQKLHE